jgi:hypothetical protein
MKNHRLLAVLGTAVTFLAIGPVRAATVLSGTPTLFRATPYIVTGATPYNLTGATPYNLMGAAGSATAGPATGGSETLLNSVGFVSGSQVFSDAISVPSAGTLTVQLGAISWLDALQNLNCFVSTPGGGILGNAKNGSLDTVDVQQPGTIYVNWYAQAGAPLNLGAYSINVNFQPTAPPTVPLPAALPLLASGLVALGLRVRRRRSSTPAG